MLLKNNKFYLISALCSVLMACSGEPENKPEVIRPVVAVQVGDAKSLTGRIFPGRAKAANEVNLSFDVAGTLNERPVNIGDAVKKGQLIAALDSRDYASTVKQARASYQEALSNFKRAKELIEKDFISKVEYDRLSARTSVTSAELEKAQKALQDTKLLAPFDGNVAELFVENFQAVQAKQQIARLVDLHKIEMVVDIPESLISVVPYATDIEVTFDAFPERKLPGRIKEIGKEASLTTRTYPVTLEMDQPADIKILPGMAGTARGKPSQQAPDNVLKPQGILVPAQAIFSVAEDGKSYVWVINESGLVKRQEVQLGRVTNAGVDVLSGLTAGDWIATAGVHFLREGQTVKILTGKE
jgi:RND family efflux transporter MFP subunit